MTERHGRTVPRRRRRSRLRLWAALTLLLAGAGWLAFLLYTYRHERPRPTIFELSTIVSTYAGDGSPSSLDGRVAQTRFSDPFGLAVDRWGNLYVADAGANNRIRKITPEGQTTTFAGEAEGDADGDGARASFNTPSAIALDGAGNLYVADTANHRIRKITHEGEVTTLAGDGTAGFRDGAAATAQFNAPVGLTLDRRGNVYVADTYNDRIRQITPGGEVKTLAGGDAPGYRDGISSESLLDTPCALAVNSLGELFIADTGNNRLRKLTMDGRLVTLPVNFDRDPSSQAAGGEDSSLDAPIGLALTHDGFLYISEMRRGRVILVAPDGRARVFAGAGSGFGDGEAGQARFNRPTGLAVDRQGSLFVADSANYLVRRLSAPPESGAEAKGEAKEAKREAAPNDASATEDAPPRLLPRVTAEMLGLAEFPWPVEPQREWHEVVATMGEVRGHFNGESRHHLHSGIDIPGALGATVRAVYDEKIASPLPAWDTGGLNEGLSAGLMTYVHMRVGRDHEDAPLKASPFILLRDPEGQPSRIRVKRGTRLRVGDALGTINRMYHVHLNFGPWAGEINPLTLPFIGFSDRTPPTIEPDGIHLVDSSGRRLGERRDGRLLARGDVRIIVDAYDQVDRNQARRRLGLYKLGYQILNSDATPTDAYPEPRINILFDRLPPQREAVRIAYADASGITVYGSAATKFFYVVTNTVRDGRASEGVWRTSELAPGDYLLRIAAFDLAGNEATQGRDLPIRIE